MAEDSHYAICNVTSCNESVSCGLSLSIPGIPFKIEA